MKLSDHFTLEEMTASDTALRLGIDNTPNESAVSCLKILADNMETVRYLLGNRPIHINSGYRGPELNTALRGAKNSAHMSGYAADFICPDCGTPEEIVRLLAQSRLDFDQLIYEGTWVHISFAPTLRRQVLTAHFGDGGTTYSQGV